MYEAFFELEQRPFVPSPLVDRYFASAAMSAAAEALTRCVDRAEGVGMLIGPSGTGKTLLCQLLSEQFRGQLGIVLLNSGRLGTRTALLQAILFELELPYRGMDEGELRLALIDHLSRTEEGFTGILVMIDEAQTLPMRLLDEVRLITNLVRDGQPRVRLVLAGSGSLEERLASPKLESFSQRIAARCYLEALSKAETSQYICNQITVCGGDVDQTFSEEARETVFCATDGIPRLINQLCDHALVLAFADGRRQINGSGIEEAWADLQQLPTPWNESAPTTTSADSSSGREVVEFGNLDDEDSAAAPEFSVETELALPNVIDDNSDATRSLDEIEEHIDDLEKELEPVSALAEQTSTDGGPTDHSRMFEFEEEEVIVDRYAELDATDISRHLRVESTEGREIAALLGPVTRKAPELLRVVDGSHPDDADAADTYGAEEELPDSHVSQTGEREGYAATYDDVVVAATGIAPVSEPFVSASRELDELDEDLIIVEDDPVDAATILVPTVHRQEYGQLFAKLRRG